MFKEPNDRTKAWLPLVYEGGKSARVTSKPEVGKSLDWWLIDHEGAAPSDWRVQVISVVTNSSNVNTTALDMVNMVYDHIERGLTPEESERVSFQILCYEQENGEVQYCSTSNQPLLLTDYISTSIANGLAFPYYFALSLLSTPTNNSPWRRWKIQFKCGWRATTPTT